jgi:UDP-N-acetylglucosamine 1-carboxyvinyltransferase
MDALVIQGGTPLRGTVSAGGSKNAAAVVLAATLLASKPVEIRNLPSIQDVIVLRSLLQGLGLHTESIEGGVVAEVRDPATFEVPAPCRSLRATLSLLGPLLARRGRARLPLPGGCRIGARPFDLHLYGLRALGAKVWVTDTHVEGSATCLHGADICLAGQHGSTVTGTCNILCAASLARGRTVIRSAAQEPEVIDLGQFLTAMGARIRGLGGPVLEVEGVNSLGGGKHTLIPDRIEAATLAMAIGATRGEGIIQYVDVEHMAPVLQVLRTAGMDLTTAAGALTIATKRRLNPLRITTGPHPGFPTDLQPQLAALSCTANGRSCIRERVFPDRFAHLRTLRSLGAKARRRGPVSLIYGPSRLQGTTVAIPDLRSGAAIAIAALAAEGESVLTGLQHLDRGYEGFDFKIRQLGGKIERVTVDSPVHVVNDS